MKHEFQTEVNQLLHLIIHSLYSHSEIFLRELVSNSSDALDKLKYLSLSDEKFKNITFDPRIDLKLDEKAGTLVISDSGIGMNDEDLVNHLGTIARSGTKHFLQNLSGQAKTDSNLIGQFGVGFYSVFMVADKVVVTSRKAGDEKAWKWTSDGKTGFDLEETTRESFGTDILIHFNKEGAEEYAKSWNLREIVKKYSNHIAFPIHMHFERTEYEGEGDNRKEVSKQVTEQVNSASALWKKSKSELKDEDYKEFYKSISGDWDEPLSWYHFRAEGTLEYTTLFYIPSKAPMDLYYADYKPGVKLYVKRVFITDDEKELLPTYLRFLRGVIDSEDLPLNVSREILQQNKILSSIKSASVKKILGEFQNMATNDPEKYKTFIEQFGRPLKEGLYQDFANRDTLVDLVRFKSTSVEGWTSFADYTSRMQPDQKVIYYITGGKESALRHSPLLDAYKKKNLEVLIMDDEIDDLVIPSVNKYKDWEFKDVKRAGASEDLKDETSKEKDKAAEPLLKKIKDILGDKVKDVIASHRLTNYPSCLVSADDDMSVQMQKMMKAMGQTGMPESKPVLEVNPDHEIIKKLGADPEKELLEDVSQVLLDQAFLLENLPLADPADFVARLNRLVGRGV